MTTPTWLTLFVGFGIGTFLGSLVSWFSAKAVTISNHRQNWINALRDDLVVYLKEVESVYNQSARMPSSSEEVGADDMEKLRAATESAWLVYRRILLRLNMTEAAHIELANMLHGLMTQGGPYADKLAIDRVVDLARRVLKQEWAVTKYGVFTKPVVAIKKIARFSNGGTQDGTQDGHKRP